MESRIAKWTTAALVAAALAVGAGCASTEQMQAKLTEMENAISAASKKASEAERAANRALSAAREAQTCCAANTERMDRMFKDKMMK